MKPHPGERDLRHVWLDLVVDMAPKNEARIDVETMAVAAVLYARANKDGQCFPSVRYLTDHAKLGSTHTVAERINRLEAAGLLEVKRKLRGKNEYTMRLPAHLICSTNSATDRRRAGEHLWHEDRPSVAPDAESVAREPASVAQLVPRNSEPWNTGNQGALSAGDPDGPHALGPGEPPEPVHKKRPDEDMVTFAYRVRECERNHGCEQCNVREVS